MDMGVGVDAAVVVVVASAVADRRLELRKITTSRRGCLVEHTTRCTPTTASTSELRLDVASSHAAR